MWLPVLLVLVKTPPPGRRMLLIDGAQVPSAISFPSWKSRLAGSESIASRGCRASLQNERLSADARRGSSGRRHLAVGHCRRRRRLGRRLDVGRRARSAGQCDAHRFEPRGSRSLRHAYGFEGRDGTLGTKRGATSRRGPEPGAHANHVAAVGIADGISDGISDGIFGQASTSSGTCPRAGKVNKQAG